MNDPTRPVRVGGNSSIPAPGDSVLSYGDRVVVAGERSLTLLNAFLPVRLDLMVPPPENAHLSLTGPPDWPVRVQRSADLTTWQDWLVVTLGNAPLELADPVAATQPRRFYRAVVP